MLNIAYNTTRLQKIVDDYEDTKAYRAKRKSQNRGRGATNEEICQAVEQYVSGAPISEIAAGLYRSGGFVKSIIERVGVPSAVNATETKVAFLPEACVGEEFEDEEVVWSAVYNKPAKVCYEISIDYQAERAGFLDVNYEKKYDSKCYAIYILEDSIEDDWGRTRRGGFSAYSLAYDLGKLEHLKEYGVDLSRI